MFLKLNSIYNKRHWEYYKKLSVIFLSWTFKARLQGTEAGIIAGGGIIHYKIHDYAIGIAAFIRACKARHIPVVINGVGIEGYVPHNIRCRILSEYMSYSNVKFISTRDDIALIQKYYINERKQRHIFVCKVPDPVIFCSNLFNIDKVSNSDIIGIGLIRGSIFRDYMVEYTAEQLADYYCGIVDRCKREGVKYEFFINGYKGDLDIVNLIEERLGSTIKIRIPQSPQELIGIIAGYKGIVTARMHSCIVAYSLKIPAVAFVWCEKLKFWGDIIGEKECFLSLDELSADLVWERLNYALRSSYNEEKRQELELSHLRSVQKAISILKKYRCNS